MSNLTHRRQTAELGNYVIQFAENEHRNMHYGPHCWVLRTKLPYAGDDARLVTIAMDEFGVGEDEAAEMINPQNIVADAGAWDNSEFAYRVWDELGAVGYRTYDGAVVLDRDSVQLTYTCDA